MKVRKDVHRLMRTLEREIQNWKNQNHACDGREIIPGSGCIICNLYKTGKFLALLQYIRTVAGVAFEPTSEIELIALLGHDKMVAKYNAEVKAIRGFPRKKCPECASVVTWWEKYSNAYFLLENKFKRNGGFYVRCHACGIDVYFTIGDFAGFKPKTAEKKPKGPREVIEAAVARGLNAREVERLLDDMEFDEPIRHPNIDEDFLLDDEED